MRRLLALGIGLALLAGAAAVPAAARGSDDPFPRPPELEAHVDFWRRIYTEVSTGGGLLHDAKDLSVVYEAIDLPDGLSRRQRSRHVNGIKDRYRRILRQLASGEREGLSAEERRVLALFPDDVSSRTLRAAARRVRFQLGQSDRFRRGLVRMGRWEGYIRSVLREHGLPEGLVAIPHVESSYNPEAHSHAGASGIWQFTRATGRRFMQVDPAVDERRDPFRATRAAARLLGNNYERTRAWPLAITAYNHGASGVNRAVRRVGSRDIAEIVERYESRTFGFASRNFYTSFLAALEVERSPERYFGRIRKDPPESPAAVELEHFYPPTALAEAFGLSLSALREANPALLDPVWAGDKLVPRGYGLHLPPEPTRDDAAAILARIPASERYAQQHPDRRYRVRRGDTLSEIASRFGLSQRELMARNGLRSRHRLRAGEVLKLPVEAGGGGAEAIATDGRHRVRPGENLLGIAQRYGVSARALARANELRNRDRILVGQVLKVPGTSAEEASETDSRVYTVRRGDTLHGIADRHGVSLAAVAALNELRNRHRIRPGQVLYLPHGASEASEARSVATAAPERDEPAEASAEADGEAPPLRPEPYAVGSGGHIQVQPDETLGHYADWLEIPTQRLRRANGLRYGDPIAIGDRIELVFAHVSPERFHARRLSHHRSLREEFYGRHAVAGTREVVLRSGDSLWTLARDHGDLPVWLLRKYNPELDFQTLRAGQRVVVPQVHERSI